MGKIVKYCADCEESFAQRFGFCPNCGGTLQAFEMNPIQEEARLAAEKAKESSEISDSPKNPAADGNFVTPAMPSIKNYETSPKIQPTGVTAFTANSNATNGNSANGSSVVGKQPLTEKFITNEPAVKAKNVENPNPVAPPAKSPTPEIKPLAAAATAANGNVRQSQPINRTVQPTNKAQNNQTDDGFHVTVIEEKNVKQRNVLLLGSMVLMLSLLASGFVYSLFNKDLLIGAIDADSPFYITPLDDAPMPVEDPPKPKEPKKDSGGGGGGGTENPDPVTKGEPPTQVAKPVAPLMMVPKMTNPDIKIVNQTQGNITRPPTEAQVGLPSGLTSDRLSGGSGSGGGFGNGRGPGAGNGRGTGEGNGIGSGSGNGNGNGNGNGFGTGTAGVPPPPPEKPKPVGITQDIKILAKPSAKYTDAARQNQFSGTVRVRVTFTASGEIGSVSAVSNAPYGLTEMAIAAAKLIKFEPAKKDGQPITKVKQIDYSFTLY